MILLNGILCAAIALRLILFVRTGGRRPLISIIAYLITVAAGIEAISSFYGIASSPSYSTVALNTALCLALYCLKGNVAELFKNSHTGHCKLTRLLRWEPKPHNPKKAQQ